MRFANREWIRPIVQTRKDHLALEFPPAGAAFALRRHLIIPWSTVRNVEVAPAPWPHALHMERLGLHVPRTAAYGTFYVAGERRFYAFLKGDRVVRFTLHDHPFREVVLGVDDPEDLASAARAYAEAEAEAARPA